MRSRISIRYGQGPLFFQSLNSISENIGTRNELVVNVRGQMKQYLVKDNTDMDPWNDFDSKIQGNNSFFCEYMLWFEVSLPIEVDVSIALEQTRGRHSQGPYRF